MNICMYCARLTMSPVCYLNYVEKTECEHYVKTRTQAKENPLPERR